MSEQHIVAQGSDVVQSVSAQGYHGLAHDSDDEPMVFSIPRDFKAQAHEERSRLLAEGADPDSVIFLSEVRKHVPGREGESVDDYIKRYVETMKAMLARGVTILDDQLKSCAVPNGFFTADGRYFELNRDSGVTKGEIREFSQWFSEFREAGKTGEVPEKWLKYEKEDPRKAFHCPREERS